MFQKRNKFYSRSLSGDEAFQIEDECGKHFCSLLLKQHFERNNFRGERNAKWQMQLADFLKSFQEVYVRKKSFDEKARKFIRCLCTRGGVITSRVATD